MFKHPIDKQETFLPLELTLNDGRVLEFKTAKTSGVTVGGWYKSQGGSDFMVKFGNQHREIICREKLLTNLARICVEDMVVASESIIGTCEFDQKPTPFLATANINGFRELRSIRGSSLDESIKFRQQHSQKFHPAFVFSALISYDDLNEENLGLAENRAAIVDYETLPSFLYGEQSEFNNLPFSLASFIGHNSPVGMALIRRRHFEDVSQFAVFKSMNHIIEKGDQISAEIRKTIEEVKKSTAFTGEEKGRLTSFCSDLGAALEKRISWMAENFSQELGEVKEKESQLTERRWKDHPKFNELMAQEAEIFKNCAKKSHEENLTEIAKIIGIKVDDLLDHKCNDGEQHRLKEFVGDRQNRHFVLHNAIICGDVKMVKWLVDNDLSDINETFWNRKHNYQLFRLTPLSAAIALQEDGKKYKFWHNEHSDEIIKILQEKFRAVNGERDVRSETDESRETGQGDKIAIWLTRRAIMLSAASATTNLVRGATAAAGLPQQSQQQS